MTNRLNSVQSPAGGARFVRRLEARTTSVDPKLAFMFEIQTQLLSASSPVELLEATGVLLGRVPGTLEAWVFQRDDRGDFTLVGSWQAPSRQTTPLEGTDLSKLIHQRWIAAHRLGHSPAEFAYPFSPSDFPGRVIAPMLINDELIGSIVIERRDGQLYPYAPDDLITIAVIASMTAQSLQMLLVRNRMPEVDGNDLTESERRRLARALHDGVVQDLAYMHLKLEALERAIDAGAPNAEVYAREIREQVSRSTTTLRETISSLRKPQQPIRGITSQLLDLTSRLGRRRSDVDLEIDGLTSTPLAPEIERAVIGIVREALQNIRKHAQASAVRIEVRRQGEELHVLVADDGVGFSREATGAREGHFGMLQMRELAEDMGGSLLVESRPGGGTRIHGRIPLILPQQGH